MRHSFIDKYSDRKSFIHSLDPRTKLICFIFFIVVVITTPSNSFLNFAIYFSLVFLLILISKVPLSYVFGRGTILISFLLIILLTNIFLGKKGLILLTNIFIKSFISILLLVEISSTTNFTILLKGLQKMKTPDIFIQILSFMYRYLFVIIDEMERLRLGWDTRYFGKRFFLQIKTFANIIGILFIRSYERGERIYTSMLSRGFDGEIRNLNEIKFSFRDYLFFIIFIPLCIILRLWKIRLL
uniref:Cobalt ECF transporter T component CbiQ n=1 Tax=candidate division WOR-3 bacterium TaxID=2052148 RepID=A0A7C4UCH4_UNCW3